MSVRYVGGDGDPELISSLTQRVEERLGDWYEPSSLLMKSAPEIRCYTNSFLLRFVVSTHKGKKAILLKIRRNPKMTSLSHAVHTPELHANIPSEFDTLRFVHERIGEGHEHFTAIRPLDYFEDHFAIVMEEFPSRSLRHLLREQKNGIADQVQMVAERAGELLRFFHKHVYSTAECSYSADDILTDAETYAQKLEQHSRGRIQMQRILDAFAEKLTARDIQSLPYTSAHQDLTCDNVLYNKDGRVCLIDIKVKPAPIYSDLGLLLVHPETFRDQIFRGGRYFSQRYLRSYRDSILKGYFAGSPMDHFLVNIYAAIRVLDKWVMHEELFHRYKGWKRVLTRPLSPLVTSYFERLWRSYLRVAM